MQTTIGRGAPLRLGALEGEPQMPAEVELDRRAVGAGQLQPMIGGVVGAGVGVLARSRCRR